MPYIKQNERKEYDNSLTAMIINLNKNGNVKGHLNYVITMLVKSYIDSKGLNYNNLSDVTGVLNDVKIEFERCVVAPYEDKKIKENGCIY